eukprot:Plantae.Rhodophyta-Purpureofilum_apyrenoidigerum.ctg19556.p1 GENE.Plantae.Rhodophyta-Purpureofilum_apyrenoidigerum.ctg19556~~Plantae.Rhodophyta-Purpureofilum_apyrenoidigerum.ctg19556.p1  ORF type:complete len:395 (+),score=60.32 Plantae.Rhodophyta-Purpureofilum_apyrenoidigerum.ctg19556:128-1312(+)
MQNRVLAFTSAVRFAAGNHRRAVHCAANMKYKKLGSSDIEVSECCLGIMTFGIQVSAEASYELLEYAVKERNINFIDTAEMYPVPSSDSRWKPGRSEEILGTWLKKTPGLREKVVIATKVSGFQSKSATASNRTVPPGPKEGVPARLDKNSIHMACDGSLRRLQTDYIDVYQIHWPDRYVPIFGGRLYEIKAERDSISIEETVEAMGELIKAGKIRSWGLGNDTMYGVSEAIHACDKLGVPRPVSIQNHYSIFDRSFEYTLHEGCTESRYNISLLPYSVLCAGVLSGKYLGGKKPKGSRAALYPFFMRRYFSTVCTQMAEDLNRVAKEEGTTLTKLMLAWCKSKVFIGSTIIGVTKMEQLKENIDGFEENISSRALERVEEIWRRSPDPVFIEE